MRPGRGVLARGGIQVRGHGNIREMVEVNLS